MGCWGITAFESDAGLDAVDFVRRNLPGDGKLELREIIEAMKSEEYYVPDITEGDAHTGPMALAEIMVNFLDLNSSDMDYNEEWAADDNKFSAVTSFAADKESIKWLSQYISATLDYSRKHAEAGTGQEGMRNAQWNGWVSEEYWQDWQNHMSSLIDRLEPFLASTEDQIELLRPQEQAAASHEPAEAQMGDQSM